MGNRVGRASLQRRLLILLLGSVATLWMLFGSLIRDEVRHEAEEVFDANLVQTAKLLLTLVEGELSEAKHHRWHLFTPYQLDEIAQQFHHYEHKVAFQIIDLEGTLLLKSIRAPQQPLSSRRGKFEDRVIDGRIWRNFSLPHPQDTIHVGELLEVRNEVAEEVTEHLFEYMLFSLPLLALLIWWSVHRGLRPISTITDDLTKRDSSQLHNIDTDSIPKELLPMTEALNRLFSRVQLSMEKERRFTADAAHELRTPLAAIKIHAQVARNEEDPQRRNHALAQITQGVDRSTHLAEQLLALARVDGIQQLEQDVEPVNLQQAIDEVLKLLKHRAEQSGITLQQDNHPPLPAIAGSRELITTLLRNLIDNAIRYTPHGGNVTITSQLEDQQLRITVRDSGPGIPEEIQQQIFERFFRNSSSVSGSGLGLSISQRIAEIHNAEIELSNCNNPDGLAVSILFPITSTP